MPKQFAGVDMADFCEVVVTKAEPLDESQSHNGFEEVSLVFRILSFCLFEVKTLEKM